MALNFDGVDDIVDYGDINAIDGAAALTVMMWAKRDGSDVSEKLFAKTSVFVMQAANADGNDMTVRASGTNLGTTSDSWFTSANGWQHIAAIYDGSLSGNSNRLKLLVNAVAKALGFTGTIDSPLASSANVVELGSDGSDFFDGQVALLKIWTAALTTAEVVAEMQSYRPMRTANLLLFAPLDDGALAIDYAGKIAPTVAGATVASVSPPVNIGIGKL